MKEKYEYKHIESDLASIAGNPSFTDMARNLADELWTILKNAEEPKQPEHEDIMNKWWRYGALRSSGTWQKVEAYSPDNEDGERSYYIAEEWVNYAWFHFRESAQIPPK